MTRTLRTITMSLPLIAAALAFTATATPAEAAPHAFCARYANSAVNQQSRNIAGHCGNFGVRWHGAWGLHYRWCRSVAKWRARDERRLRNRHLHRCGA